MRTQARAALLAAVVLPLAAQTAAWQEFSIGPAVRKPVVHGNDVLHGALHANSISLRALIAIAADVPAVRIVGPEWIDGEFYQVSATISKELRLRTREETGGSAAAEFRSLLSQELARRFHLETHREMRDRPAYTLRRAADRPWNLSRSAESEHGRISRSGTPLTNATTRIDAHGIALSALCSLLQRTLETPVAPDPSLPDGAWDFRLKWKTGDHAALFQALRDQLGLELAEQPRDQQYLIVDRVERPVFPPSAGADPGGWRADSRDRGLADRPPRSDR